jgi:WhiB family transcriptional regulator, redox-sensing transcriptional regulator
MGRRPSPPSSEDAIGDDRFLSRDDLACRGHDPDLWFSDSWCLEAKDICAGCAARDDCLEYALARPWLFGIWGGTSGNERDRIRKERQATP